uniref:Uncharacterized protein n=1 Tax=Arundo donax TaxID=35708 RepID=A0A0A9DSD0_ARUDO
MWKYVRAQVKVLLSIPCMPQLFGTPSSLSRTKLNSIAPIHSQDSINDGSLSPISIRTC